MRPKETKNTWSSYQKAIPAPKEILQMKTTFID